MKKIIENPLLEKGYSINVFHIDSETSIDSEPSTKLFLNENVFQYCKFGHTELQLLFYILQKIGRDKDYIKLKIDDLTISLGKTKPTVIKGLQFLETQEILKRKSQSEYWVSPYVLFRGNRVEYFKQHDVNRPDDKKLINTIYRRKKK